LWWCTTHLARPLLADEAHGNLLRRAALIQTEALDVRVHRDALRLGRRLDLLNLRVANLKGGNVRDGERFVGRELGRRTFILAGSPGPGARRVRESGRGRQAVEANGDDEGRGVGRGGKKCGALQNL
jgi:hypothetical protein